MTWTYIAVFAVVMAICSWISIPATVPFTLQTFGVFLAVGVLGGKRGTLSILVYISSWCSSAFRYFAGFSGGIRQLVWQRRWLHNRFPGRCSGLCGAWKK